MQTVLSTLNDWGLAVLNFLNNVPAEYYAVILAALPFSIMVAFVKTFVQRKWDMAPSETKMFLTNFFGLVLLAIGAYLQSTPETDPVLAIAGLVGITTAVQQPFFFRFVKPFVRNFWENWDRGRQLNDEMKSAAVPPAGLPLE